jgi:hypothetical protein
MEASTDKFSTTLLKVVLLTLGLLSFNGCLKKQKPSYILLAVDRLAFNSFSCNEEKGFTNSGLAVLCQESIRFTNAYTTSTQSAAALGSILSGTYPFQNQLHKNTSRINHEVTLVSELLKTQSYRTSLFSANANIMKRTGLSRGFEHFDDFSFLNYPSYTVPFNDQVNHFKDWFEEDLNTPFFSVIYNSDLETLRIDENFSARTEEFDENLFNFIQYLKKENQWERNYIIVVGLQGRSEYNRINETNYSNLHSENINVSFFIKPPRLKGDEGIHLKIDSTSSLVDFGFSLIKLISPEALVKKTEEFAPFDYSNLWSTNRLSSKPVFNTNPSRTIIAEAVDTWSENLKLRFALLFGNFIYIEKQDRELFNKLNDGFETIDLKKMNSDVFVQAEAQVRRVRQLAGGEVWASDATLHSKRFQTSRQYWLNSNNRDPLFELEKKRLNLKEPASPVSSLLIYYLDTKKPKDSLYEESRRVTYNLAFENIWGLWQEQKQWPQPPALTKENQ